LVHAERLRRDVDAYRRVPPTTEERALTDLNDTGALHDDTDWEALYADHELQQRDRLLAPD
jgi:hypothetical protein